MSLERALVNARCAADRLRAARTKAAPAPAPAPAAPPPAPQQRVFRGIPVVVDRPKGHVQTGTAPDGTAWRRVYHVDYGYVPGTLGGDGEGLDVFIGGDEAATEAHWVLQRKADGSFDEYKCLLPGQTLVGTIVGGSKAFYTGQVVKLRMASGHDLSVTPNHPVLTPRGLVPAGRLKKGDHLLAHVGEGKSARTRDHEQHPPTLVEEVFSALAELHPLGVTRKLVAPLDFHGDAGGFHGEVEVVRTYRELRGDVVPQASECVQEGGFIGALPAEGDLVRSSSLHAGLQAEGSPGVGAPSTLSGAASLLGQHLGGSSGDAQAYRFGEPPDGYLAQLKASLDRTDVYAQTLGDVLGRLPAGVSLDQIVHVELVHYSGPVFDFESTSGLIVANRVVVSNCMLGFPDAKNARAMYEAHVPKRFFGSMCSMPVEMMKALLGIEPVDVGKALDLVRAIVESSERSGADVVALMLADARSGRPHDLPVDKDAPPPHDPAASLPVIERGLQMLGGHPIHVTLGPGMDRPLAEKEAHADLAKRGERVVRVAVAKDAGELRYVLGIVLEPDVVDAQGDVYGADEIRKSAWEYLVHFRNVGLMHKGFVNGRVRLVESFVAPADMTVEGTAVKKGTWLLGLHIVDDALWAQVKSGDLGGLSMGGMATRTPTA